VLKLSSNPARFVGIGNDDQVNARV